MESPRKRAISREGVWVGVEALFGVILGGDSFNYSGKKNGESKAHCPVEVSHDLSFFERDQP